jgi:hypothetical protein
VERDSGGGETFERRLADVARLAAREVSAVAPAWALLLLALLALAGRGGALSPAYSNDDYLWIQVDHLPWQKLVAEGRFGAALLFRGLEYLGAGPQWASTLLGVLHLLSWPVLALATLRFWGRRIDGAAALLAAAIVSCHPFATELFTYRTAQVAHLFAFGLVAGTLVPLAASRRSRWGVAVAMAVAISVVQTALHVAVMIGLTGLALWCARLARLADDRQPAMEPRVPAAPVESLGRRSAWLLAGSTAASLLYAFLSTVIVAFSDVRYEDRVAFLAASDLTARWNEGAEALLRRTLHPGPLLPWGAVAAQSGLLVLGLGLLGLRSVCAGTARARRFYLLSVAWIGLAGLWTLGSMWVLRDFHPSPRVTFQVAIGWAALLLLGSELARSRWVGRALVAISALLVLSYLGTSNRILADQQRLNLRDQLKANRILADLEKESGFGEVSRLAVVGGDWAYPASLRTLDGLMNVSAFYSSARTAIFVEVSGRNFGEATAQDEARARAECAERQPWPSPEGVVVGGELAMVCLERRGRE